MHAAVAVTGAVRTGRPRPASSAAVRWPCRGRRARPGGPSRPTGPARRPGGGGALEALLLHVRRVAAALRLAGDLGGDLGLDRVCPGTGVLDDRQDDVAAQVLIHRAAGSAEHLAAVVCPGCRPGFGVDGHPPVAQPGDRPAVVFREVGEPPQVRVPAVDGGVAAGQPGVAHADGERALDDAQAFPGRGGGVGGAVLGGKADARQPGGAHQDGEAPAVRLGAREAGALAQGLEGAAGELTGAVPPCLPPARRARRRCGRR